MVITILIGDFIDDVDDFVDFFFAFRSKSGFYTSFEMGFQDDPPTFAVQVD